jgi:cytochrome P450
MVGLDGSAWKRLRAMFNPGFASGHLMTLLPYMVDMSVIFCEKLREKAKTGEIVEMEELAARLTIDIMGKIVLQVLPAVPYTSDSLIFCPATPISMPRMLLMP